MIRVLKNDYELMADDLLSENDSQVWPEIKDCALSPISEYVLVYSESILMACLNSRPFSFIVFFFRISTLAVKHIISKSWYTLSLVIEYGTSNRPWLKELVLQQQEIERMQPYENVFSTKLEDLKGKIEINDLQLERFHKNLFQMIEQHEEKFDAKIGKRFMEFEKKFDQKKEIQVTDSNS